MRFEYKFWPVVNMETGDIYTVQAVSAENAVLEAVYTDGIGDGKSREEPVIWLKGAVYCGYFAAIHDNGVK